MDQSRGVRRGNLVKAIRESDSGSGRDPVDRLFESFLGRLRRGERPSLDEFAGQCPERADEIRELFPALLEMERLKAAVDIETGPYERPSARGDPGGPRPPAHPERLGDYRILRVIGEGGMGVVYEAEHESLSNRVALKVMHPRFRADGSHLRRFRLEARSAARLHHTNIVPVFAFGEQGGICYYAMPFIVGVGLNEVLDDVRRLREDSRGFGGAAAATQGRDKAKTERAEDTASIAARGLLTGRFATAPPTPTGLDPPSGLLESDEAIRTAVIGSCERPNLAPKTAEAADGSSSSIARQPESIYYLEIARLGAQVADALDHAHRQGVVHRDIKPSNLLLDAQGNVWVTDFGLAKLVEGDELSQSRDLVGTLRFMAPERFRGVTDCRCDIYSLGATLYEMLALRPAFDERDQIRLIDEITHRPPVPLREHDRRIPRDLETLVLRAMAKDADDRFAAASELRDELRRFLEGRPIRSRPVPVYERLWRWCKRNQTLAAATITAAALIVFLAVAAPIAAWTYRHQLHQLEIEQFQTKANLARAEKAERQDRLNLGKAYLAEGSALQRTGQIGQRFDSLDRLGKAASSLLGHPDGRALLPELRDQAITAMGLTDLRLIQRREIGPVAAITWDAALERYALTEPLARAGVGGQAVVRSMADDRELFRIPRPGPDIWWAWPGFSPNGRYLLVGYEQTGGGQLYDIWHLDRGERVFRQRCNDPSFHPDGRRLIYRPNEKVLAIWDLVEGRETRRLSLDFVPAVARLDPEGRRIAVNAASSGPPRVVILDLETGHVLTTWSADVGDGTIVWSQDGRLLAIGNHDGRVFIRDVNRGTLISVLHEDMGGAEQCFFAPEGPLLLVTNYSGPAQVWDAALGRLLVTASIGKDARFSADGRRLAIHDGSNLDIWEIAHEQERITLNPSLIGNRTEQAQRGLIHECRFSPDGRLIAMATEETTYVHEGRGGRLLARLDTGYCMTVLFDREGRNLFTYSDRGLFRWPIRDDPGAGRDAIRIGPPVLVRESTSKSRYKARWLLDGRTLAMNDPDNGRVWLVDTEAPHPARRRARALATPSRSRMISVAISPDGRWAAAGGWNDHGVYVWDLPRRRFERIIPRAETPADGSTYPSFSPDGRWLVVSSEVGAASGYYFWEPGTWRRGPFIPRPTSAGWQEPVFSPDGSLLAISVGPNRVRLHEMATGRTIAHLTTLEALSPAPMAFSPDGTRLIASTARQTALIWDLRRIRDQLRTMGLDWDQPPYPPSDSAPDAGLPEIRSIRVVGEAPRPAARRTAELAAAEARLRDHPDDADALLDRGWLKLKMSRPAEALPDLERGARFRPDDLDAMYLLALAQIGTNDQAGAFATLERYLARAGDDTDARIMRARLALQLGRLREADDELSKALDLDPRRDPMRFQRAEIRLQLGRLEDALADLDALVPLYPADGILLALRGQVHERLGHLDQADADRKQAAKSPMLGAQSYNTMAWKLATGPAALRDPRRALEFARKAVAASPDTPIYLNTLGVAQYRAGLFAEAIASLEKSLAASNDTSDAFDLFFLAMARHRLGRLNQARADFDRALKWRRDHPNLAQPQWPEELDAFEVEARSCLAGPPPELPNDVFAPGPPVRP